MTGIAQFLQMYGGWGIAAVALMALAHVYKSTGNLLEKRHVEYVSILRETSVALISTTNSISNVIAALDKIEIKIQESNATNIELKQVIEYCKARGGNAS